MSDKIKLTGLKLETKEGQPVELSIEEAKDLYDQLHELFGKNVTYVPSAPIVIERNRWRYPYDQIWCKSSSDATQSMLQLTGNSGLKTSFCGTTEA